MSDALSLDDAIKRAQKAGADVRYRRRSGEYIIRHPLCTHGGMAINARKKDAPAVLRVLIRRLGA